MNVGDIVYGMWDGGYAITQLFGVLETLPNGITTKHTGIDIGMPTGTELFAPGFGTVVHAGPDNGFGTDVIIQLMDGSHVLLAHLRDVSVRVGESTYAGLPIGHSDSTGQSTGPHLHLQYSPPGKNIYSGAVDPSKFLSLKQTSIIGPRGVQQAIQDNVPVIGGVEGFLNAINPTTEQGRSDLWRLAFSWVGVSLVAIGLFIYVFGPAKAGNLPQGGTPPDKYWEKDSSTAEVGETPLVEEAAVAA